jgi:hypothetical protein
MTRTTNQKITLAMSALILMLISASAGVMASFFYLASPMDKWQGQFSETYLPLQTDALKALREGKQEKALAYLEMATSFSLLTMGQQRSEGPAHKASPQTIEAVQYLCAHPPMAQSGKPTEGISFGEACLLLQRP